MAVHRLCVRHLARVITGKRSGQSMQSDRALENTLTRKQSARVATLAAGCCVYWTAPKGETANLPRLIRLRKCGCV